MKAPSPFRGTLRQSIRDIVKRGFPQLHALLERRHCRRALARVRPLRQSAEYHAYLAAQFMRGFTTSGYVAANRAEGLLATLQPHIERHTSGAVLCLGCRNTHELQLFAAAGFEDVIGVDLFSIDPRILTMDMHALAFPPGRFDIVFLCHSFEHALEPATVLREVQRVSRAGAVCAIEVPIRFRKWEGREDLHDFGSVDALRRYCAPIIERELYAGELATTGPVVARFIFSIAH